MPGKNERFRRKITEIRKMRFYIFTDKRKDTKILRKMCSQKLFIDRIPATEIRAEKVVFSLCKKR